MVVDNDCDDDTAFNVADFRLVCRPTAIALFAFFDYFAFELLRGVRRESRMTVGGARSH
jgi:hypothetical protein